MSVCDYLSNRVPCFIKWSIPHNIHHRLQFKYYQANYNSLSVYLSSHNSNKTCIPIDDYKIQLKTILDNCLLGSAKIQNKEQNLTINVNLMGEPLDNPVIINHYPAFYNQMINTIKGYNDNNHNINIIVKLFTTMPYSIMNNKLIDIFQNKPIELYYHYTHTQLPLSLSLIKLENLQYTRAKSPFNNNYQDLPLITFCGSYDKTNMNIVDQKKIAEEIQQHNFMKTQYQMIQQSSSSSDDDNKNKQELNSIFYIMDNVMTHQS